MAGLPMKQILGDRACEKHPDCPKPCVQCAGMALSQRDQAKGGYRGNVPRFEADPADKPHEDNTVKMAEAEIRSTISRVGRQRQLHAAGQSFYG